MWSSPLALLFLSFLIQESISSCEI
jgi:hypothetical protein